MGIKNLFSFIKKNHPNILEQVHISEYAYKKVAIDISLYLHKYKASAGDRWLSSFVNLITCLRKHNLHCIFIFDGQSPPEKAEEQKKRRDVREKTHNEITALEEDLQCYHDTGKVSQALKDVHEKQSKKPSQMTRLLGSNNKEKLDIRIVSDYITMKRGQLYTITNEDFDKARKLFKIMNVPYTTAIGEADPMCADLCRQGLVDAVLSDDSDIMVYGAPIFLTKLDTRTGTCTRINHPTLLESFGFTYSEFMDFCIMCGCDYNTNIDRVGPAGAFKHLTTYRSIENISEFTALDVSILKHETCRRLFIEYPKKRVKVRHCGEPNFNALEEFAYKYNIRVNVSSLRDSFTVNTSIIFED